MALADTFRRCGFSRSQAAVLASEISSLEDLSDLTADQVIQWAGDTSLSRKEGGGLVLDTSLSVDGPLGVTDQVTVHREAGGLAFATLGAVGAGYDSYPFILHHSGQMEWGPGNAGQNVILKYADTKRLRSDGAIGFWSTTPPAAQPAAPAATPAAIIALLQQYGLCAA